MSAEALHALLARHRAHARDVARLAEDLAQHHGLAWADFVLLDLLHGVDGRMPLGRAADDLGLSPLALRRQALPLEKLGLLAKPGADLAAVAVAPTRRDLSLSPAGRRLLREARRTAAEDLAGPSAAPRP